MSCFNHFLSFLHCSIALVVIIAIALVAVVSSCVALGYYCYIRRKVRENGSGVCSKQLKQQLKGNGSSSNSKPGMGMGLGLAGQEYSLVAPRVARGLASEAQVFTYRLLQQATDNFSPVKVVGHGGFGCVYRGTLPDGKVAAIKQLDWAGKQGDHEFRVEVDMLSRLHSHFLLDLIGYCADQDHRLLVYEFMPNGSLQEHLYPDISAYVRPTQVLDWRKRMRIALDAARGLEYLHELVRPPIIHRDLKSSNILLDDRFNAKVSDFGLAKHGSEKVGGHVSTRVLGTTGYVAPEYALTGHLTTKSDVYSYGVVLLELITGRVPVDMKRPPGQGVLVSWALPRLTDRDKLIEMVDPALGGHFPVKELIQVAAIAAMCVQPEADYRPLMTDVVQSLVPLVRAHLSSSS